jgi:L,D-transpeptidase YcbB
MGGRASVAGFGAAAQVFLLTVLIAGAADAVEVPAEAQPADLASSAPNAAEPAESPPSEADQESIPAASPASEDEILTSPAPASAGEDEPTAIPAAAPASEEGRDPADAIDTAVEPPSGGDQKPADTAAVAPGEAQQPPTDTAAPAPSEAEQQHPATAPTVAEPPPADPIVAEIRLKLKDPVLRKGAAADDLAALEAFYGELAGPPLWITTVGFSARAGALIAEIQKAGEWGLAPEAFDLPPASDLPATTEAQAIDEIKLALAILKYARFAKGGRVAPARISVLFDQKPNLRDPRVVLSEIAASASPGAYLTSLHPKQEQFENLRRALIKAVAASKARGRKPGSDAIVQRLIVNMERWRWMPAELGSYYVWSNVPAFTTRVMKDGKSVYVEKASGQIRHSDLLRRHALRRVPSGMGGARDHQIRGSSAALAPKPPRGAAGYLGPAGHKLSVSYQGRPVNAETIDWGRANIRQYTFTQAPGPDNVLGVLKFNFPNRHAVYMHDTLQPELFNEVVRTLSHGCIRLRQPDRLAALLLAEDKGWSAEQVKSLLAKGTNSVVSLSRPVPVHLTYFTMAFDGVGRLQTFADVYGLDKKMAQALFGKSESLAADAVPGVRQQKRSAWNGGVGGTNFLPGLFGN